MAEDVSLDTLNILIFGESGAGKTHFASNCDNVAVFSCESQGRPTIKAANPKAMIFPCKTMADLRKYTMMAATTGPNNPLKRRGVKTLVFDSITEIQQMMMDEIQEEKRKEAETKAPASQDGKPATKGKAPEMTKADWGTLAVKMRNFLRVIRDLEFNVVVLALCEPTVEENTGVRRLYPKLSGSMQQALPGFFNIVGYLYKTLGAGGKVERVVMIDGPDGFLTKSYGALQGLVQADLRAWLAAIAGNGDASAKGAKMPGQARKVSVAPPEGQVTGSESTF